MVTIKKTSIPTSTMVIGNPKGLGGGGSIAKFLKRKYEAKLEISKGRGTVSRISGYETHVHVCERDTVCVLPPKWMSATASTLWMTMIHVGCFDILEKIPKPCLENLNSNFCSLVMKYIVFCQTNLKQNNLNKCVICQQQQTKFKTYLNWPI